MPDRRPETDRAGVRRAEGPSTAAGAAVPGADGPTFLRGGGEVGALVRATDWSRTPLGPAEAWPQSLRTALSICLASGFPVLIWWGPELIMLYNDAYRPMLGDKHPRSLGQPGPEVWTEIWDTIGPMLRAVLEVGRTSYFEDLMLLVHRRGFVEECYFTFTYSPIRDESGGVGGVFCAVSETTQRVYGERQLALLRDLAAATADARTYAQVSGAAVACLAHSPRDTPFAALYLSDPQRRALALAGAAGVATGPGALPEAVPLADGPDLPLSRAARTQLPELVAVPAAWAPPGAGLPGPRPQQAMVLPVAPSGESGRMGVLVLGLNPQRELDDGYRAFLGLVAGQVAAGIGNAQAYEEERRRADALAELDRAKTAFFANVSHEFRTPLTLMLGPTEDALRTGAISEQELRLLHRNALRLLKLVNSLLEFARAEAARAEATYRPTDLAAATADLVSNFRAAAERAGLRLVVDCPPLPEPAFVDRDMWERIVLNLLSNAIKFTFEGEIRVALRPIEDRLVLTVADTGEGIAPDELPRLFERFHRARGQRARSLEGSGIGLALVRELVRLHGGEVEVASALGAGTTFTVRVPAGRAHLPPERVAVEGNGAPPAESVRAGFLEEVERWLPSRAAGARAEAGSPARALDAPGETVLVVDDNADMRAYLARLLGERWRVEVASDGEEALARVRRARPDLVLTDVMMPRLDGFGLLERLRAAPETRDLPVVVVTARAGEESRVDGADAGADDYLVKPFSARELVARVGAQLELARMRQEATRALREREAEAREHDRRKSEFLAVLSHELRNPLAPIRNGLALLEAAAPGSETERRALEALHRQTEHLNRLVDDLLDVTRVDRGTIQLQRRRLDAAEVIRRVCEDLRSSFEVRGVRLSAPAEPARAAWVDGDATRLAQMIGNLLNNALKFTPAGGEVRIELAATAGAVEIRVRDTGMGIEPADLTRIFDPFVQGDRARRQAVGGLGIGLALVRELARLHGGTVQARSAGPGLGAEFALTLPRVAPPGGAPASAQARSAAEPAEAGLSILVVEDNLDAGATLGELLALKGNVVQLAATGREGIDRATARRPDVLICDVGLPDMSGYDVVRAVRALPGPPILAVALTGYAQPHDRAEALQAGFDAHLPKPPKLEELAALLRSARDGREKDREGEAVSHR